MPTRSASLQQLAERRGHLRAQIAAVGDLRPGSLVERFRRCGKPTCHCAEPGARAHGPSYSLTHAVEGKTITKIIPAPAVERTRAQIAEHRRFRELTRRFVEVNEQLCEVRLASSDEETSNAGKKNSSARSSRRKSPPRSKRS